MMAKHTLLSSLSELPLQGLIHRGLEGVTCVCKGLTRLLPEGCGRDHHHGRSSGSWIPGRVSLWITQASLAWVAALRLAKHVG